MRTMLLALLIASSASAQSPMLIPDKPSAKTDEVVTFTFQYGHPFKHELLDAPRPSVHVHDPEGKKIDLPNEMKKVEVEGPNGKKLTAYTFAFVPEKRGVYIATAHVARKADEAKKGEPTHEFVKVYLPVQSQDGWDRRLFNRAELRGNYPSYLEVAPLTRPVALTPGTAFHVEAETHPYDEKDFEGIALGGGRAVDHTPKPVALAPVEAQKYNPAPPKALPPDEFITRALRTSRRGEAVATLDSAGWWCVSLTSGIERHTICVHVDERK